MSTGTVSIEIALQTNSNVICFESRRKGRRPRNAEITSAAEHARQSYEHFVSDLAKQRVYSDAEQGSNVISLLQVRLCRKAREEEALQSLIRQLCS